MSSKFGAILLGFAATIADAEAVHYAWEGTIQPVALSDQADPWGLGREVPFRLEASVDPRAPDSFPDPRIAAFSATNATLWIDGEPVEFGPGDPAGTLGYIETHTPGVDRLSFGGFFTRDGVTVSVGSSALLPSDTHRLDEPFSRPPVFDSAVTSSVSLSGATALWPYLTTVGPGQVVLAIPEPVSVSLAIAAIALLGRPPRR